MTVGGGDFNEMNQKTEILTRDVNDNLVWSFVQPDFNFASGPRIYGHSLVTVESSHLSEEYVILTGGYFGIFTPSSNVFKFNGTWSLFGQLKKPRYYHTSIDWNGAVYIIGGRFNWDDKNTKMEIWKINDSPDQFRTTENWPELFGWENPHLFIVQDSFFLHERLPNLSNSKNKSFFHERLRILLI